MSGGHFDLNRYVLEDVVYEIEENIESKISEYSLETLKKFNEATEIINKASIYIRRIDWLLSGDDGEESFHERLERSDLEDLETKN